jgi:hypothetical protein
MLMMSADLLLERVSLALDVRVLGLAQESGGKP